MSEKVIFIQKRYKPKTTTIVPVVKWNGINYLVVAEKFFPQNSPRHHNPPLSTPSNSNYLVSILGVSSYVVN